MPQYFIWLVAGHVSFLAALVSSLISHSKSVSAADSSIRDTRPDERHHISTPVPDRDLGEDSSDSDEVASQDSFQDVSTLSLMFTID
jgi:hypothetical protein